MTTTDLSQATPVGSVREQARAAQLPPLAAAIKRRSPPAFSLSMRLAAIYGLLVAATVLVVAGVALMIARAHLERGLEQQLRNTAQSFQRGPGERAQRLDELATEMRRWLSEHPLPLGQMAAVRLADGRVLTSAGGLDLFEVSRPRALLTASSVRWWNLEGSEGDVRGLTVPIRARDQRLGTLVLLAYQRPVSRTLHALLTGIAAASAAGLAFALLLGIVIVRRSLRPLRRMAAEVSAIEATGDLSQRVGLCGHTDEVGRLARAFDRMLTKLEGVLQTQRRFLADASHELRTPLTVARGQLELVADQLDPACAALALATGELDRMARIVDDLLLLARLDEGLQLRCQPVEVELVVREALLRGLLLAPREVRVCSEPNLHAHADPERLLQVLTNLVTNAIRHTDERGCIALRCERQGDDAVVQVHDNGCGIPAAELPHVFERFYRGAKERAAAPEGTGLGLAIATSLVAAMQGTIEARSTPALGTTFTIRLPKAASANAPAGRPGHETAEVRGASGLGMPA